MSAEGILFDIFDKAMQDRLGSSCLYKQNV